MNTDKLNADFMDLVDIALSHTHGINEHDEITGLIRQFKDHLDEIESVLADAGVRHV